MRSAVGGVDSVTRARITSSQVLVIPVQFLERPGIVELWTETIIVRGDQDPRGWDSF